MKLSPDFAILQVCGDNDADRGSEIQDLVGIIFKKEKSRRRSLAAERQDVRKKEQMTEKNIYRRVLSKSKIRLRSGGPGGQNVNKGLHGSPLASYYP